MIVDTQRDAEVASCIVRCGRFTPKLRAQSALFSVSDSTANLPSRPHSAELGAVFTRDPGDALLYRR